MKRTSIRSSACSTSRTSSPSGEEGCDDLNLAEICREPFFVPETKRVQDLLDDLRAKNTHLAVIVDEYGGTSGIVTIEDIIEEIIGEIRDEYDTEEEVFTTHEDGSVLVHARVSLNEFEEHFATSLPRGGYDTLGGFIIHLLGKVPRKGEEISHEGLRLLISGGDNKRITRVTVFREGGIDDGDERQASQRRVVDRFISAPAYWFAGQASEQKDPRLCAEKNERSPTKTCWNL